MKVSASLVACMTLPCLIWELLNLPLSSLVRTTPSFLPQGSPAKVVVTY